MKNYFKDIVDELLDISKNTYSVFSKIRLKIFKKLRENIINSTVESGRDF